MGNHKGKVLCGNARASEDGNLTPTVILNPSLTSDLMTDETFGPILPIITYKNLDEAISIINSRDKPLAVYYFGKNSSFNKNLTRLRSETSSGAFLVNDIAVHFMFQDLPFGGVGASGYGRCHGKEGFMQCSNKKSCLYKTPLNFWPFTITTPPFTKHN